MQNRTNGGKGIFTRMPGILLALSMTYVGVLGIMGVNFGHHWDENKLIEEVQDSALSGRWLPAWYNYPSVSYDIAGIAAAPTLLGQSIRSRTPTSGSDQMPAYEVLGGRDFHLELRSIFFLLSTLSALPVYLLFRQLAGSSWIALFAALTSISTWEFTYQARWIAPDCLLAMFVAWSALAEYQILNSERGSRRVVWVVLSAILAGLSIGTKYPGGIVIVPLLLAVAISGPLGQHDPFLRVRFHGFDLRGRFWRLRVHSHWYLRMHTLFRPPESLSRSALLAATALLVASAVFFATTPGSLVDRAQFIGSMQSEMLHYQTGHGGHTVGSGWDHFSKLLVYLGRVFLSRNKILAVSAAALSVLGAAHLVKTRIRIGIWFLSLPVLYVLYFSQQRVMFVRNYVVLLPFLAILAGLGLLAASTAIQHRGTLRWLLCAAAVFYSAYNLDVATRSALSIFHPHSTSLKSAIESELTASPQTRFYLTPMARCFLGADSVSRHPNIESRRGRADWFMFLTFEAPRWELPANVPGQYRTVWSYFDDVNWDYYPDWLGHFRVLEISAKDPSLGAFSRLIASTQGTQNYCKMAGSPR